MCPICWGASLWLALAPPEPEVPEEVLRTEIYVDGRSPVDGRLLSAGEYAALQEFLADDSRLGEWVVNPELRHLVELLRLRRTLKQVAPFLP